MSSSKAIQNIMGVTPAAEESAPGAATILTAKINEILEQKQRQNKRSSFTKKQREDLRYLSGQLGGIFWSCPAKK